MNRVFIILISFVWGFLIALLLKYSYNNKCIILNEIK